MAGQILALSADHFAQPLFDFGVVYIVVVHPALVAGVVGRIDVDALHPALIPGQQGFEGFQIVPVDNHVLAAVTPQGGFSCAFGAIHLLLSVLAALVKAVLPVKHPEGDFLTVVDDLLFSNPFQCCGMGRSSLSLLSQKTFPVSGGPYFVQSNPRCGAGILISSPSRCQATSVFSTSMIWLYSMWAA